MWKFGKLNRHGLPLIGLNCHLRQRCESAFGFLNDRGLHLVANHGTGNTHFLSLTPADLRRFADEIENFSPSTATRANIKP